jgi:hypothetical protein
MLCQEVQSGDLVMTMGAGNVWQIADDLLACLDRTRVGVTDSEKSAKRSAAVPE